MIPITQRIRLSNIKLAPPPKDAIWFSTPKWAKNNTQVCEWRHRDIEGAFFTEYTHFPNPFDFKGEIKINYAVVAPKSPAKNPDGCNRVEQLYESSWYCWFSDFNLACKFSIIACKQWEKKAALTEKKKAIKSIASK